MATTVLLTAPRDVAPSLAETLVEERLAACVNRVPCESTYRWEGEVVDDEEAILLAKTAAGRAPDLIARIEELHPYDVPCVERFDAADAADPFAAWVASSVDAN